MQKSFIALCAALLVALGFKTVDAAITPPAGAVPAGLPSRMLVGVFEQWGERWMRDSTVPWDVRYAYFVKGWANNWGYGAHDGSMATNFFNECATAGFIPAVQFYQMNGEAGGGEGQFYQKTQNAGTMASYFRDFKLLLQRAKEFNKPVIVMLEADGFAYMQQQTNNNPSAYSAVAATGLPELAGLPNTAAGWSLAFLQLKKSVGATNVALGIHISGWASGKDVAHFSVTDPLQPEVDKVYNFLAPLGIAANQTGLTYDFLVGDPLDRDADYYRIVQGQDRWWNTSDTASISSKSFNRYAEWLRLWNAKSNKRWLLWQIPVGNSNHLNVYNNGGAREGYKDNRAEYFFGANSIAHLEKFASSGVFGLLFGAGTGGQSSFQNDIYTDGQPYLKSRAGAFLRNGGLAIPSGTTTTPTPPSPTDATDYNFEADAQGWAASGTPIASVARSTAQKFAGASSLAVRINGTGTASAAVTSPAAKAGQTVTYRIFLPTGARISWIQPFILQGAAGNWAWTGTWQPASALKFGAWNTITVQVPPNAATLSSLGVQFATNGAYNGTVYIDSVNF